MQSRKVVQEIEIQRKDLSVFGMAALVAVGDAWALQSHPTGRPIVIFFEAFIDQETTAWLLERILANRFENGDQAKLGDLQTNFSLDVQQDHHTTPGVKNHRFDWLGLGLVGHLKVVNQLLRKQSHIL